MLNLLYEQGSGTDTLTTAPGLRWDQQFNFALALEYAFVLRRFVLEMNRLTSIMK